MDLLFLTAVLTLRSISMHCSSRKPCSLLCKHLPLLSNKKCYHSQLAHHLDLHGRSSKLPRYDTIFLLPATFPTFSVYYLPAICVRSIWSNCTPNTRNIIPVVQGLILKLMVPAGLSDRMCWFMTLGCRQLPYAAMIMVPLIYLLLEGGL